jgi:hypothetical protein
MHYQVVVRVRLLPKGVQVFTVGRGSGLTGQVLAGKVKRQLLAVEQN